MKSSRLVLKRAFVSLVLLTAIMLLAFSSASSQFIIKGRVTDLDSKKPIEGADAGVIKAHKGDKTDADGRYEIKLPDEGLSEGDVISMQFSAKGYSNEFEYFYYKTNSKTLDVSLRKKEIDPREAGTLTTRIYKIRYRNPEQIFQLIEPFLSSQDWARATVSQDLKTITIKDGLSVHEKIGKVIWEYDIPLKKIWLEVTIIRASRNGGARKGLPPEIEKVVKKLNTLFKFNSYEIVSRGDAMGVEESMLNFTSAGFENESNSFHASTRIGFFDEVIKLEAFRVSMFGGNDITTSLNIKNGDTVVVGSSRGRSGPQDGALITVVTAKVVEQ